MKYLIALFALVSLCASAQTRLPMDSATKQYSYSEVVIVDSTSKDELYLRAKEWFANSFKSANDVLQMDDKEAGKLIGKGNTDIHVKSVGLTVPVMLKFTVKVTAKDNRYRYEITNLIYRNYANEYNLNPTDVPAEDFQFKNGKATKMQQQYIDQTDATVKALIASLKTAMQGTESEKDEW